MVKILDAGFETALVIAGWIAFFVGFLSLDPTTSLILQTVARVLPLAGDT